VTVALSMITGIPLLGEKVWRTGPVVILTYEDDQLEWHRRIAAACLEFDLDYAEICGSIYFISRPRGRIALAAHAAVGNRNVIFPDHAEIVAHLKRIRPVLFIIDPLNHAHALDDGNSNVLIAQLAAEVSSIAAETMVALLALHHLRKGATGSLDDMMGAVALRATFRATRILAAMTDTDAKNVGLDEDEEIWRYRRIASSKENYAPPADKTLWFQLESRDLGNVDVDPTYPGGDNVQVFKPFKIPEAHNGFTKSMAADILDQLRKGPEQGEFYLPHQNAKESWAGWPICEIAEKSAREAGRILADWIKNGIVIENDYPSPKRSRHLTARIIVNEPKAAAMLGALYRPPA